MRSADRKPDRKPAAGHVPVAQDRLLGNVHPPATPTRSRRDTAAAREAADPNAPAIPLRSILARFWPQTRGLRRALLFGIVLVAIGVPLEALAIYLFKLLVDDVLQPADFAAFPPIAGAYVGLAVAMGLGSFASRQLLTRASERFVLSLRTRLFAHLQTLSMDFFESRKLGDLLTRVGNDVSAIETLVLSGLATAISAGLRVGVYGVMLFVVDPTLAGTAVVVSPLLWVVSRFFTHRLKDASRESRRQVGTLSSIAEENLAAIGLVQAYNREGAEVNRFAAEGRRAVATALRSSRLRAFYSPLVELVELCGLMLVIGYGTYQLAHHQITLGDLLVFMAYFAQLYGPLRGLAALGNSFSTASAGAERIIEILDARPSVMDRYAAPRLRHVDGVVEFRDVSFCYPGQGRPAVQGVSFAARPGQLIAIVGRSGSGKSTLGKLLLRFYDPTDGAVLLDGRDIRDLALADLRQHVAVVMQETLVMDGTIAENVRWGRPDASSGWLRWAVAASDLETVVADLPDGLDTQVGYRGRKLSGGQRQRVAIARAMVRDAPVLLLDEPATGLDPIAEERIMSPLRRLMTGRTTVLISHSLSAVRDADLILVLDRGRVVEQGTHQRLLALGGHYHRLYVTQQTGVEQEPGVPSTADPAERSGRAEWSTGLSPRHPSKRPSQPVPTPLVPLTIPVGQYLRGVNG